VLTERQFRHRRPTIYNLYQEACRHLGRAGERAAAFARYADAENGRPAVDRPEASPLLRIRRLALSYTEAPIELRISLSTRRANEYFADIGKPRNGTSRACPSPPSFAQLLNGLAGASALFLVAAGLHLIFGVTRVVNFRARLAYMLGRSSRTRSSPRFREAARLLDGVIAARTRRSR
jgi:hypothetical protein